MKWNGLGVLVGAWVAVVMVVWAVGRVYERYREWARAADESPARCFSCERQGGWRKSKCFSCEAETGLGTVRYYETMRSGMAQAGGARLGRPDF